MSSPTILDFLTVVSFSMLIVGVVVLVREILIVVRRARLVRLQTWVAKPTYWAF